MGLAVLHHLIVLMRVILVLFLLAALGCNASGGSAPPEAQPAAASGAQPSELQTALEAVGLTATTLDVETDNLEIYALASAQTDAGAFHIQWADLREVRLEQILADTVAAPEAPGYFARGSRSPMFGMLSMAEVTSRVRKARPLAVINGAFFETPREPSTRLAFPIARSGEIVTGGSSPNGPGSPGASGERWDRPLRALAMDTPEAHIVDVDPASGAPLGAGDFADAMASYAPEAHPTRLATRFHLIGALDRDGDGTTETLVIVTNDGRSTIDDTAALLDALGVAPEARLAPDGGASVFVWNRSVGVLHRPTGDQPLPHYLTLRLR